MTDLQLSLCVHRFHFLYRNCASRITSRTGKLLVLLPLDKLPSAEPRTQERVSSVKTPSQAPSRTLKQIPFLAHDPPTPDLERSVSRTRVPLARLGPFSAEVRLPVRPPLVKHSSRNNSRRALARLASLSSSSRNNRRRIPCLEVRVRQGPVHLVRLDASLDSSDSTEFFIRRFQYRNYLWGRCKHFWPEYPATAAASTDEPIWAAPEHFYGDKCIRSFWGCVAIFQSYLIH